MNFKFLSLLILTLLFSTSLTTETQQQDKGTNVVFFIQYEPQQPNDYVQINIQIKSQQPSLEQAINQAASTVKQVEDLIKKYCQNNPSANKKKKQCEQVVQTSQYQIDPIYQLVRKVPTFVAFSVEHQMIAKVINVKNIGKLADDILKRGVSKINSFQWKPFQEIDGQQKAVSQGIQKAQAICNQIGMKLDQLISVSEVSQYGQEQEQEQEAEEGEQEEQQEQQEQQEDQTIVYRFEISCQQKEDKKKK